MFSFLRRIRREKQIRKFEAKKEIESDSSISPSKSRFFPLLVVRIVPVGYSTEVRADSQITCLDDFVMNDKIDNDTLLTFVPKIENCYFGFCDCDSSGDLSRAVSYLEEANWDYSVWKSSFGHSWVFFDGSFFSAKSAAKASAEIPGTDLSYRAFLRSQKICVTRACFNNSFLDVPKIIRHGRSKRLLLLESRIQQYFMGNYDRLVYLCYKRAIKYGYISHPTIAPNNKVAYTEISIGDQISYDQCVKDKIVPATSTVLRTVTINEKTYFVVGNLSNLKLPAIFVLPDHVTKVQPCSTEELLTSDDQRVRAIGHYALEQQKMQLSF